MEKRFPLGIQSYCFRNFKKSSELVNLVQKAGLQYCELCGCHLDLNMPDDELTSTMQKISNGGIMVNAFGVVKLTGDNPESRRPFEFGYRFGLKALSVDFDAAVAEEIDKLAEEFKLNVAIHNHGKNHALGTCEALDEVFAKTSPRVGLCLDTAWATEAGEKPLEMIDKYKDRLYGVHLKDFAFDSAGNHEDVILGTGTLDLQGVLNALNDNGFKGYLSIEYEGTPENPLPAIIENVEVVNRAMNDIPGMAPI